MQAYPRLESADVFASARGKFEKLRSWLEESEATTLQHQVIEKRVAEEGREVLQALLQGYFDLRKLSEPRRTDVKDASGNPLNHLTPKQRALATLVGVVSAGRLRYGARRGPGVFPMDVESNLPEELYSLGLRRLAALEASRGSYEVAAERVKADTGVTIPKRQMEELAERAAEDFGAFYGPRPLRLVPSPDDLLVLTFDAKGLVMRPDSLRKKTRQRLAKQRHTFKTRLSWGEKKDRKRMATVAAVYDVAPHVRTPADVLGPDNEPRPATKRPRPSEKRVWASVEQSPEAVIAAAFEEAELRDLKHERKWIVPVDGDRHQIARVKAEAKRRGVEITLVLDFVHVLEYLWKAAWCLHARDDAAAEVWVLERGRRILEGHSSDVAAAIRRSATKRNLAKGTRKGIDDCARYLLQRRSMLRYADYLAAGFPIASGVIEGACRHLIVDRMDITGARWGVAGAEAILKLRSLKSSGDFDDYWRFHEQKHHERRAAAMGAP
jgi:hypothetical protein